MAVEPLASLKLTTKKARIYDIPQDIHTYHYHIIRPRFS